MFTCLAVGATIMAFLFDLAAIGGLWMLVDDVMDRTDNVRCRALFYVLTVATLSSAAAVYLWQHT